MRILAGKIPLELSVVICCARKNLTDADRTHLSALLSQPLKWNTLLHVASENGLLPLLARHLSELRRDRLPEEFLAKLSRDAKENSIRIFFLTAELLRVMNAFQGNEIPAIPFKGAALAARAYGNISLRCFHDLDFVVPQRSVSGVFDALESLGYESKFPRERISTGNQRDIPGEYAFVHATNGARVEIHTELTFRHFPLVPPLEEMIQRSTSVVVDGMEMACFAIEDELLFLAMHGAKDFWARLLWVADVAEFVKHSPEVLWTELFARGQRMKMSRMLNVSLILAMDVLGLSLPADVMKQIEQDSVAERLVAKIYSQWFGIPIPEAGLFQRSAYRIRMVDGFWNGVSYWLRLSTSPEEEDWSMVTIPRTLGRSYAVFRPLRLWRKYGQRASRGGESFPK